MIYDPFLLFLALIAAAIAVCLALDETAEQRDARRRNQARPRR